MSGVPYIRFFGDDWLSGTNALSLEERGALVTIVALIASTGGPVPLDMDRLPRRFGCTKAKTKKLINALQDQGKIRVIDGVIHQEKAENETKTAQKKSEKATKTAHERWGKSEGKSNEINDELLQTHMRSHPHSICQPEPEPEPEVKGTLSSSQKTEDLFAEPPPKKKPKRATSIPENWVPSDRNIADALSKNLTHQQIQIEGEKFRDYHLAKGTTYKNWDAGWRTWIGNAIKFAGGRNGSGVARRTTTDEIGDFAADRAARKAAKRRAGGNSGGLI